MHPDKAIINTPSDVSQEKKGSRESVEVAQAVSDDAYPSSGPGPYRLYKQRWLGCLALFLLETVASMSLPWFGPISDNVVRDFGFTLDEINWLGNVIACMYLPSAFFIPMICSRWGIRRCCEIGCITMILSAWIRYAGVPRSLPVHGAYALIILGQVFVGTAQPVFQVLAPRYSEVWFDLKGRTTATMLISIANPIGGAIGQLVSPIFDDTRKSILVLGIVTTAVTPVIFLVAEAPPTPPTFSGSQKSPSIISLLKAWVGLDCPPEAFMTRRERFDFTILVYVFSVLLAAINTFSILSSQWLSPVGYSDSTNGFIGATLLLSGIVAALATAPIFDRVFTRHLGLTIRILCPIIGASWLALIWAVRPGDAGGLFAIMAVIGASSISLLPVALELACELTRNADGSSAVMWFFGNLFCVIYLLCQGALRASPTADPPLNMHQAIIFNGAWVFASCGLIFFFNGKQARRERDEKMAQVNELPLATSPTANSPA
ncbi:MFS general substrate transporter [Dentipellis sp. KUC8613]|nr:MFS general substrate transporter [Dentipellis sp. KUC8613]